MVRQTKPECLLGCLLLRMALDRQEVFFSGAIGITGNEHIHLGAQIARDGVFWPRYDWLVPIEAGVENHGHAGELGKFSMTP